MEIKTLLRQTIENIRKDNILTQAQQRKAIRILQSDNWTLLTQSPTSVRVSISEGGKEIIPELRLKDKIVEPIRKGRTVNWDEYSFAALQLCADHASWMSPKLSGRKYTREGMIQRVMEERREKAEKSTYTVKLADNLYGEHQLTNEKGKTFHITLWDFSSETGYIDNIDWRTNKLGTTKHIIFLYDYLKRNKTKQRKMSTEYPFVEITLDPLHEYKIRWIKPDGLDEDSRHLIEKYFGEKTHLEDAEIPGFLPFLRDIQDLDTFNVRPEVLEKIDDYFNRKATQSAFDKYTPDYSAIKANLYPYQKEGVEFVLPKLGAIIADEMGLGKTIQAIAIAVLKKQIFGFDKTLVICPASLKYQWKSEIEKFSQEAAIVIEGNPDMRAEQYQLEDYFFYIVNYEMVLRDIQAINESGFDFVILDEAQKIKNFSTKTAIAIKKVKKEHSLVITGTPVENKLVDLYSIIQFVEPYKLTPLWEFSYQHCLFDLNSKNRIIGYYNLSKLKKRLNDIIIRREKRKVIDQLPNLNQKNVYVKLHDDQAQYHASFQRGLAKIIAKKFKTQFDWQKLMMLLNNMRMSCNSTYLIDKKTNYSTKLIELRHILTQRLNLKNNNRKVIIFSEWINMLNLIADLLVEEGYGYVMLTGSVPVKKRKDLIKEFAENDHCRIFLSTESGGAGLNLQAADIVINFELPWNPAKKNQRIGRIDRLGQKSDKLSVFNLVSVGTIEQKIATGLLLKQNLFDGVLSDSADIDKVDFSEKGRAQFIRQLEDALMEMEEQQGNELMEDEVVEVNVETLPTEETEEILSEEKSESPKDEDEEKYEHLETVLNKGMEFLSGIYKMASGEDLQAEDEQSIKVDRETGEVTMKFKIKF